MSEQPITVRELKDRLDMLAEVFSLGDVPVELVRVEKPTGRIEDVRRHVSKTGRTKVQIIG